MKENLNYLCHIHVEEWHKIYVLSEILARKGSTNQTLKRIPYHNKNVLPLMATDQQ